MARKRFKARQPATMQEAIRLCLDYAEHEHNRSVALHWTPRCAATVPLSPAVRR